MRGESISALLVCRTREDVEKAKIEYLSKRKLKLSLRHCVFQNTKRNREIQELNMQQYKRSTL